LEDGQRSAVWLCAERPVLPSIGGTSTDFEPVGRDAELNSAPLSFRPWRVAAAPQ
jgi:hypothetical protein